MTLSQQDCAALDRIERFCLAAVVGREIEWDQSELLVSLVDFKWLMGCTECHVDLSRLCHDLDYADQCLQRGLASKFEAVRERSRDLLPRLARTQAKRQGQTPMAHPGPMAARTSCDPLRATQ